MTISAASISSIVIVKQIPWTATTSGVVRNGGLRLQGSIFPSGKGNARLPSAIRSTNFARSIPALKLGPFAYSTPQKIEGSSSRRT